MFHNALFLNLAMANVQKGKGKGKQVRLTPELVEQQWGILLKGKIMKIPQVILDHIRATPTAIMGWCDQELMNAWKFIFPLTKEIHRLGTISMADPAWQEWENPWWVFLTNLPYLKGEKTLEWRKLHSISVEPILWELNPLEALTERRMLMDKPIAVSFLGNMLEKKLLQVFHPNFLFNLLVCQREMSMGIMEHTTTMLIGEGSTKRFLKEMGWSLKEQIRCLPQIDECPTPDMSLIMNIIMWNCRRALNPNFHRSVADLVRCHSPTMMIITKTCVGSDRAKEITDTLPFDGVVHADTIGYAEGLWLLWNSDFVDVSIWLLLSRKFML